MLLANGRFVLHDRLGKGGFGEVFLGVDTVHKEVVAIKVERGDTHSLYREAKIMHTLYRAVPNSCGFPQLFSYGEEHNLRFIVMSQLGPSLEDVREAFDRLSPATALMLGIQMISRLEYMHTLGFLHRDIKPDNWLMGKGKFSHFVFIVDFGLATRYMRSDGSHKEMISGRSLLGTTRYASIKTHEGFMQSRRDDLEQLCYNLIYLVKGRLPWTGLKIDDPKEKEKAILEIKKTIPTSELCSGCPRQFEDMLLYSRKMEFEEEPQYEMCRMLLQSGLEDLGLDNNYQFDWLSALGKSKRGDSATVMSSARAIGAFSMSAVATPQSNPLLQSER